MEKNLEKAIEEFLEQHKDVKIVHIKNFGMGALYDSKENILYAREDTCLSKPKT